MKKSQNNLKLLRQQLDTRFAKIPLQALERPKEGWIRTLRKSLGMSGTQLAQRLNTDKQTVRAYELSEIQSKITLSTLEKVAEALDAKAYVIIIPNRPLHQMVQERSKEIAQRLVSRNFRNMEIEAQGLSQSFQEEKIAELSAELARNSDRRLWDDD